MDNIYNWLVNNQHLYSWLEVSKQQFSPIRLGIVNAQRWLKHSHNPLHDNDFNKILRSGLEVAERVTRTYRKPDFNILACEIDNEKHQVEQTTILTKSFCKLLHFKKNKYKKYQPKLLIIAPMAGHHATLLRDTLQYTLPHFDVYITDWISASQVPLEAGKFDMDDYIDYLLEFFKLLSPKLHVLAVCQPTVPALAATALISASNDLSSLPQSLTLMGGPVDARKNPTQVDEFAMDNDIDKITQTMITEVPANYPGAMRKVYPGFFQLAGFLSMNIDRHIGSHMELFKNLVVEDDVKAEKQRAFYDEYFSVMDLTAEFYLQTVKEVFQDFVLAKGEMVSNGRKVDLSKIDKVPLLGVEGQHDDIAAVGQTKAALSLCSNLPESYKSYYLQQGVGHYGVFSGSKFRDFIVPVIRDFAYKFDN